MIAGTLEIQLLANMARLSDDMQKSRQVVTSAMGDIEKSVVQAKSALAALGIGLGIGYFASLIKGSIDAADHLHDLGKSTGLAVEDLAGLRLLAQQTGTDLDGLAKGINKMSVEMGKDPEKFKALGITATNNKEAFKQFADVFNLLPDINQRNALAQAVFSKSWAEMAPALSEGGKKIGEIIERGAKLSGITLEMTQQADAFNDKLKELTGTGGLLTGMVGPLLPLLNSLADDLLKATEKTDGLKSSFSPLAEIFKTIIVLGANVSFTFTTMGKDIARMVENLKLIASGDFAGSRALGEAFRRDAAAARQVLDEYEKRIMGLGLTGKAAPGSPAADPAAAAAAAARAKAFLDEGKAAGDTDSAYRNLLKTLREKLLTDHERTEVAKLQIALDEMSAKQLAAITPARAAELKDLAAKVDLANQIKDQMKRNAEGEAAAAAARQEDAAALAAYDKQRDDALVAGYKNLEQLEFEAKLIGSSNDARDVAIAMRALETSEIDKQTESYQKLREQMKDAILSRNAAEEAKRNQVGMWQSIESAGHQAFLSIFDTSKSVLERIRDMLKTHLLDLLYQITLKPWIVQIAGSMSGAGVAQAAFGSSGAGGIGNLLSLGSSGYSAASGNSILGSLFSGGSSSGVLSGSSLVAGVAGTGVAEEAAALGIGGGAAAGGMAAIGAAIPYVGLAIAAASLLGLFGKGGGPKASDIGIYTGANGMLGFTQNNVTDSAWGQQYAEQFGQQYAALGPQGRAFMGQHATDTWQASGPASAQSMVSQYIEPLLAQARAADEQVLAVNQEQLKTQQQLLAQQPQLEASLAGAVRSLPGQLGISSLEAARMGLATSESVAPLDRFSAARGFLNEGYGRAMGGDLSAVQAFPELLQSALGIGRDVFASGPQFAGLFVEGNRMLNDLLARQNAIQADITANVPMAVKTAAADQIAELRRGVKEIVDELQANRDELARLATALAA